jgi:hypothetical protein
MNVVAEHWHDQALGLVVRPVKPQVSVGRLVHVNNYFQRNLRRASLGVRHTAAAACSCMGPSMQDFMLFERQSDVSV